jgi:Ca2+-binding EF-hand superfamily protein
MEKEFTFELTQEQKNILTPQEIAAYIKAFKNYDANHDGTMDEKEFKSILIDLGERKITDEEAAKRLADNDTNRDGVLSFSEFVNVMIKFRKDISKNRTEVVFNDDGTVTSIVTTKGGQGFNKFSHQ